MNIQFIKDSLEETKKSYFASKNNLLWLEQYTLEIQNFKDYEGREILELLQNADDAQSSNVEILLDTDKHHLSIANSGDRTILFSEKGIRSIMASHLSPKKEDIENKNKLIGAKGLGFKSVLNWASKIRVMSDNIDLCFSEDIVLQFWDELKTNIKDAEKYESIAINDGRKIPLPILRLPQINLWENPIPKTTIIELSFKENKIKTIKESLESFKPETLLFLHNLKNIVIEIDGNKKVYSISTHNINGSISEVKIGHEIWIKTSLEGSLKNGQKYEVAAAFCMNSTPKDSYEIYSFFPTEELFPFPCILHASLALNASRKALQTGEDINLKMMSLLADRMISLAEYLKQHRHDWSSYKIVHGSNNYERHSNIFIEELKNILKYKSQDMALVPILNGSYTKLSENYYYNDSIFDFVKETGKNIFKNMRLKDDTTSITLPTNPDSNYKKHIEEYARSIHKDNIKLLAKFIKLVCLYHKGIEQTVCPRLKLLRDDYDDTITCTAYLNTGRVISDIPNCKNIKYVNKILAEYLVQEFEYEGKNRFRDVANSLKCIIDIQASDIAGIKRQLIFSQSDNNELSKEEKEQVLQCLYKLYLENKKEFCESKEKCYLPTKDEGWEIASNLIFADKQFPDGIRNLNLSKNLYPKSLCVAYPDFLAIEECENITIQNFYCELGVNKYFPLTSKCYGDDSDYLDLNEISKDAKQNCTSQRTGNNFNITDIPSNIKAWSILNLTDLIKLITKSGLISKIADKEQKGLIWYYGRGYFGPEPLKISYLAYLIRKYTIASKLQHYIIGANKWILNDESTKEFTYDKDELIQLMLKKLGAKSNYSDFSTEELYTIINNKAIECEKTKNYTGIQDFYHEIKQTIDSKPNKPQLPTSQSLKMLCKINGTFQFMDSRKIFYSDNKGSEKLRSILPVLEMRLRDGEDQIHKYFGCQRFKDIHTQLISKSNNQRLTDDLYKHIEKLKPYILALTSKNYNPKTLYASNKKSDLNNLKIEVVEFANYKYNIETLKEEFQMSNGDFIYTDSLPYICYKSEVLKEALEDPAFCNTIAEIICITLKLSTNENIDKFYRLLKSTERELDYIIKTEVDENLWVACLNVFGISKQDKAFWKKVFEINKKTFNESKLENERHYYIKQSLNIEYDRTTPDGFITFHKQQLQLVREEYLKMYLMNIYESLKEKGEEEQKEYLNYKYEFCNDEWIDNLLSNSNQYFITLNYQKLIIKGMKDFFNFIPNQNSHNTYSSPSIHQEYLMGHSIYDLSLNSKDESLLYFDNKEEYFKDLINKKFNTDSSLNDYDTDNNTCEYKEELTITLVESTKRSYSKKRHGNSEYSDHSRKKLDDKEKKRLGNNAEDKVYKALKAPNSNYEIGRIHSRHLNSEGDDNMGFDLEYRRKGESIFRCLEIKHSDGKSIIVSRHEFEVSQSKEYRERYDIALVVGNSIKIWKNAFLDDSKYTKSSDDYTINFEIHEID